MRKMLCILAILSATVAVGLSQHRNIDENLPTTASPIVHNESVAALEPAPPKDAHAVPQFRVNGGTVYVIEPGRVHVLNDETNIVVHITAEGNQTRFAYADDGVYVEHVVTGTVPVIQIVTTTHWLDDDGNALEESTSGSATLNDDGTWSYMALADCKCGVIAGTAAELQCSATECDMDSPCGRSDLGTCQWVTPSGAAPVAPPPPKMPDWFLCLQNPNCELPGWLACLLNPECLGGALIFVASI